jgi:predicted DNA-binding transcriptional regulator AlpA
MNVLEVVQITPEQLSQILKEVVSEQLEQFTKDNPKQSKGKELLSREETRQYFGISKPCLHDWTKKGILKAHKVGGRVFYKRSEIEQLTTKK